jgi:hypothetical protein
MDFDNERDRFSYGYDAGTIVDGVVTEHEGRLVLVDDEGTAFDPQAALKTMVGHKVRLTMIKFESIENIANMVKKDNSNILD